MNEFDMQDLEEPEPAPAAESASDREPSVEDLLREAAGLVDAARPMPLSASVMINKDEVLDLIQQSIERLPDELKAARWLLRERDEFLGKVQREGDEMIREAQSRVAQMVQRSEVAKSAQQYAGQVRERADAEARQMRHEVEDFCDQRLASFEIILERTQRMVAGGRAKLQGANPLGTEEPADDSPQPTGVFDQEDG